MNTQNLVPINGLDVSGYYSFDDEGCPCDNANDNPGVGW